jgi:fatty acid synthase
MVTENERRFKAGIYGIPRGFGALKEIDKFDADFFGVNSKQAARMDPQLRIMLEVTYEAMQDAGDRNIYH